MPEKVARLFEDIKSMMKDASEWTRRKTTIPGIFVVRMPGTKLRVMLLFSPTDEAGNPRKRGGLFFADMDTVQQARRAFPDERLDALIAAVQQVNGPRSRDSQGEGEVLEI